jgi:hypothetical protein
VALTPTQARVRGQIGALRLHALHDPRTTTAPSRAVIARNLNARLLAEIDAAAIADGVEPPAGKERDKRLERARSAHFKGLILKRWSPQEKAPTSGQKVSAQEVDGGSHPTPTT